MQATSGLGNFTVSIQLAHRGTMTMFQSPALYQPPAVTGNSMTEKQDIPESILNDLIELFGQEKTDRILNNRLIDFRLIILMILRKKFILRFNIYPEYIILFIAVIVIAFYLFY